MPYLFQAGSGACVEVANGALAGPIPIGQSLGEAGPLAWATTGRAIFHEDAARLLGLGAE